ncbi:MAG: Gfo/Idh/MocA family oxidoreductase [Betaproteobacteria bacterium]
MQPLRIAVAGAGMIGRRHMELIATSHACTLAAVVDPAPASQVLAQAYGVAHHVSLAHLLAGPHPDAVIIATPNHLHVTNAIDCIAAGVPALIEKPVAHTMAEGHRLAAAAARSPVPLLVGHHRTHSSLMRTARDIVQSGVLGPLVAVMGSALFYKPDSYFDEAPWRREVGGGPILINLIHEIGNLRSLCGEIVAVQALTSNAMRHYPVEDTVAIGLRFANGALGTFMVSDTAASAKSWEQTSQENQSYATYPDEDCYTITGSRGSLAVPTMRMKVHDRDTDRSWWKPMRADIAAVTRDDPLARQLDHFCTVIRGEVAPLVTVHDGLQNLRVIDAIAVAAASAHTVEIDPAPIEFIAA